MDAFSPALIAAGLKAMLGKGYRSEIVRDALNSIVPFTFNHRRGRGAARQTHYSAE